MKKQSLMLIMLLLLLTSAQAGAGTVNWNISGDGLWSESAKWSPVKVPNSRDDVFINNSGTGTITIDTTAAITTLTVGGAKKITLSTGKLTLSQRPASFKNAGLYVQFEQRGFSNGFYPGDMLRTFNDYNSYVGSTVSVEIGLQLDKMKAMGVNTITFQLRSADDTNNPQPYPSCQVHKALGPLYPLPTETEMANLLLFFDMVQSKGMKVWLSLINMHMEELPRTNSETWLGAILGAIGDHPALDLVLFDGSTRVVGTSCGIQAEANLWMGPDSVPAKYVQWAIGFAMGMDIPARKLSAEAVVGNFFLESQPTGGGPDATDNHLWSPIVVSKMIFDNLNIPASDRTYALSFYENRKCSTAQSWQTCIDLNPHDWADQTLQYVTGVVGSSPRIVATEMGDLEPVDQVNWKTQHALESIVFLMQKYGMDGGAFWRWVSFDNSEDSNTTRADPVKRRGLSYVYNPVQKEIIDMCGFHVPVVNGSFEGATVSGVPASWTAAGNGTVAQYLLTAESGQPEVPSRGTHAMRITTGTGSTDTITATSTMIPVVAATAYTTTANMRFAWTGDPNPTGSSESRPQAFISILYFQANGTPSAVKTNDSFSFFQENSTTGFATFPQQYTTPGDAAFVEIQFGAMRNGLPTQIILDVDNVR